MVMTIYTTFLLAYGLFLMLSRRHRKYSLLNVGVEDDSIMLQIDNENLELHSTDIKGVKIIFKGVSGDGFYGVNSGTKNFIIIKTKDKTFRIRLFCKTDQEHLRLRLLARDIEKKRFKIYTSGLFY